MLGNLFLTVFQVIVDIVSGSQELVADGVHSLSGPISDIAALIASQSDTYRT